MLRFWWSMLESSFERRDYNLFLLEFSVPLLDLDDYATIHLPTDQRGFPDGGGDCFGETGINTKTVVGRVFVSTFKASIWQSMNAKNLCR
jgi:hypothetical protein